MNFGSRCQIRNRFVSSRGTVITTTVPDCSQLTLIPPNYTPNQHSCNERNKSGSSYVTARNTHQLPNLQLSFFEQVFQGLWSWLALKHRYPRQQRPHTRRYGMTSNPCFRLQFDSPDYHLRPVPSSLGFCQCPQCYSWNMSAGNGKRSDAGYLPCDLSIDHQAWLLRRLTFAWDTHTR